MKPLLYVTFVAILLALGYAAFEWTRGGATFPDPGPDVSDLAEGEFETLEVRRPPRELPEMRFELPDGTQASLADYRGKTVLVNLWATWCAPCIKELPTLAALQDEMGGDGFEVVTISLDTKGAAHAASFLEELGIDNLPAYTDPDMSIMRAAGVARGLPTTLLVDERGREIARFEGDADWNSPAAQALVDAAMNG